MGRKFLLATYFVLFSLGCENIAVAMEVWPQLVKHDESDNVHCEEALKIAKSVFYSDSFRTGITDSILKDINSTLVMGVNDDGGIIINQDIFEEIRKDKYVKDTSYYNYYLYDDKPNAIYWQRNPINGIRLVLDRDNFRTGIFHELYAVKENISDSEFDGMIGGQQDTRRLKPFIKEWFAPSIFEDKTTHALWIIDTLPLYVLPKRENFLISWYVYSIDKEQVNSHCTIRFHPQVETPEELLPNEVAKLSKFLYSANGEANTAAYTWANVALRPWAVVPRTHNTRKEVDIGLKRWAGKTKFNSKIYQDILQQYKKALPALAKYYETNFNKTPDEAMKMATRNLDIVFRSYFVFSKWELRQVKT